MSSSFMKSIYIWSLGIITGSDYFKMSDIISFTFFLYLKIQIFSYVRNAKQAILTVVSSFLLKYLRPFCRLKDKPTF